MSMMKSGLAITMVASLCAGSASAAVWTLSGTMDPQQAGTNGTFGTGTGSGTGTISGTYDDVTNLLDYDITWSNLTSSVTNRHFHIGAPGASGPVALGIDSSGSDSGVLLNATQETDLLAGNWYVNIHTSNFAGGEIRGQVNVVPEPQSAVLIAAGALLTLRRRRRPDPPCIQLNFKAPRCEGFLVGPS